MTVTDKVVATLHAQLKGQFDEFERLLGQLNESEAGRGLTALVNAAFYEATQRRFMKNEKPASDAEVIDFVAATREKYEEVAESIDPDIAERLINYALEKLPSEANRDIDRNVAFQTQHLLMLSMVTEADYNDEQVAQFMREARDTAEEILS
jgi:hypothetical protein